MTYSAAALFVRGELADALEPARRVIGTYREEMADFYDWRDNAARYEDADGGSLLRPAVNSHYTRQTFWWAIRNSAGIRTLVGRCL